MDGFPYEDLWVPDNEGDTDYQYVEELPLNQPIHLPKIEYVEEDPFEDINIQESYQEVQDEDGDDWYSDVWIPYSGHPDLFESGTGNQQVIIGSPYPAASDLKLHFCDLYPEGCLNQGGPLEKNATERSNGTLEADVGRGMGLNHVDLSGFGLALLLLLLILLGLNGGWSGSDNSKESDTKGKKDGGKGDNKDQGKSKKSQKDEKDRISKGEGDAAREKGKRKKSDDKDSKRQERGDDDGKSTKSQKRNKKDLNREDEEKPSKSKKRSSNGEKDQDPNDRRSKRSKAEVDREGEGKQKRNKAKSDRNRDKDKDRDRDISERENRQSNKKNKSKPKIDNGEEERDRKSIKKRRDKKDEEEPHKTRKSRTDGRRDDEKDREYGKKSTRSKSHKDKTDEDGDGRHGKNKQKSGRRNHKGDENEKPDASNKKDRKKSGAKESKEQEENGKGNIKPSTKDRIERKDKSEGDSKEEDPKKAKGTRDSKKNRQNKNSIEDLGKGDRKGNKDGKTTERKDRKDRHKNRERDNDKEGEQKDINGSGKGKPKKPRDERPNEQGDDKKSSRKGQAESEGDKKGGRGGRGEETGNNSGSAISPPVLLGLLVLLALMGFAGKNQIPNMPHMPVWRTPTFFSRPGGVIGGGILGDSGSILSRGGLLGKSRILDTVPSMGKEGLPIINSPKIIPAGSRAPKWVVNEPETIIAPLPVTGQTAQAAPGGDGKTQIHINNVNSQGNGNPINVDSNSSAKPVGVVMEEPIAAAKPIIKTAHIKSSTPPPIAEVPPVIIEEKVWEPINFHFSGPTNPDRLWNMLLVTFIVIFPLITDWILDYPQNKYSLPDYLAPAIQLIIIITLLFFGLMIADWHFGWTATIAPYAEVSVTEVQGGLTPILIGVIETTESLIWEIDDVIFGDGRILLGMGLAALGVVLLSQREPITDVPVTKYASATSQLVFFLSALLIGILFWNA
ncbi:hypothetical protein I317_04434 [Kwoniella heveanensis CBS 569]|nr:hypothetical protein I317_04434 [Kwoniella heveanensis CBS 569]